MIRQLLSRLTYANVVATVALFAALGTGGAYAATQLAKDSVGSKQLRKNAVTARAVKNGTLGVGDLSKTARSKLRGTPGPAGPTGAAATTYRAAISGGCGRPLGSAIGATEIPGGGGCAVTFPADVSQCVYGATLAAVFNGAATPDPGAGRVNVASSGGGVVTVRTYDAAGAPAPLGFHLLVACS